MRFKNKEAEAAAAFGKPITTKSGEKMRPPPKPTMVSSSEIKNMAAKSSKEIFIKKLLLRA